MTNEELAIEIFHGNKRLLPELWQGVERFAALLVSKNYEAAPKVYNAAGLTEDDLIQEMYFAMLQAVEYYGKRGGEYKFITFFGYTIKRQLRNCTYKAQKDVMQQAKSLDAPIEAADNNDRCLGDTVPSEAAALYMERAENAIALSGVFTIAKKVLAERPDLYEVIENKYLRGIPYATMARVQGVTLAAIAKRSAVARRILRKNSTEFIELGDEFIGESYKHSGLKAWKRTGTSSTEWAVIKRDAEKTKTAEKREKAAEVARASLALKLGKTEDLKSEDVAAAIEHITDGRLNMLLYRYYIQGFTMSEIGAEIGVCKRQILRLNKKAVEQLKAVM